MAAGQIPLVWAWTGA